MIMLLKLHKPSRLWISNKAISIWWQVWPLRLHQAEYIMIWPYIIAFKSSVSSFSRPLLNSTNEVICNISCRIYFKLPMSFRVRSIFRSPNFNASSSVQIAFSCTTRPREKYFPFPCSPFPNFNLPFSSKCTWEKSKAIICSIQAESHAAKSAITFHLCPSKKTR